MALHRTITNTFFIMFILPLALVLMDVGTFVRHAGANERAYHHLVLLGDPHLPGNEIAAKEKAIRTINSWDDVRGVVVLGDICYKFGTLEEYAYAKYYLGQLKKPLHVINGNHDYFYNESISLNGEAIRGYTASQEEKLKLFKRSFNLPELYYTLEVRNYLLIFLAADELGSDNLVRISKHQLDWLRSELDRHKKLPTIVFFHAPLKGTLKTYNQIVNTPNFVAQPEDEIREVILQNPQLFLWVSGHTHTPPTNDSYAAKINLYEEQVTNIHNCDMNRQTIWTNSLYLYSDKVLVQTFDHKNGVWIRSLRRTIIPPRSQP